MDFLLGILNDLKGLLDPFLVLIKGLGHIIAKIFTFLADIISNASST